MTDQEKIDLTDADLRSVERPVDLTNADLMNANLSWLDSKNTILSGANLTDAILPADLTGASYNATNPPIGLSPEQMGQLRPEDRPQDESKEQVGLTEAEMLQLKLNDLQNC